MKKGASQIDWIVGLVFFLGFVVITFYYISYIAYPKFPQEQMLKLESLRIAEAVVDKTKWTVYRTPIIVTSSNTVESWPFELYFQPNSLTDLNSIVVLDENKSEIYSEFNSTENRVMWVSNITNNSKFYIVHTDNTSLSARSYSTDINRTGYNINNSRINVTFTSTGISTLFYLGSDYLVPPGILIVGMSTTPSMSNGNIRAKSDYLDGTVIKIYANNSRIMFSSNHTYDISVHLFTSLTNFYNGTVETFSGTGQQYQGTRDFIDTYGTNGVTIISNDTTFTVANYASYRQINLSSVKDFEIYIHSGDYNAGITENSTYLDQPTALYSVSERIVGLSQDKINEMFAQTHASLKSELGITNMDFNISIIGSLSE